MIRSSRIALLVAVTWLVSATPAFGLQPPAPRELARYAADGTLDERTDVAQALGNDEADPGLARSLNARAMAAAGAFTLPAPPAGPQQGLPATGAPRVLAIGIDFPDAPAQVTSAALAAKLDGVQNAADPAFPYESLRAYYQRSSLGALDIRTDVAGWYRHTATRASIAPNPFAPDLDDEREALIESALRHFDSQGLDLSRYDNDGDGVVDYLIVVWSGNNTGWGSFWWGYYIYGGISPYEIDGVRVGNYSWQWELRNSTTFSANTVIHETGHALGLPDYYDYELNVGPDGGLGGYDMMDGAAGDHNAFSKWMLGWVTPATVDGVSSGVRLRPSATTGDALAVMQGVSATNPFDELFLVENRQSVGNDVGFEALPSECFGVAVWHVDARLNGSGTDFALDNSVSASKLLALEQADGLGEIEASDTSWVDSGDFFGAGAVFGPSTVPASARNDGSTSGVTLSAFVPGMEALLNAFTEAVDVTPPVTTSDADGVWRAADTTITLTAVDDLSGVAATYYRVDGAEPWVEGSEVSIPAPADGSNDGPHAIEFHSVDQVGNIEPVQTVYARIDRTAPRTTAGAVVLGPTTSKVALSAADSHSGVGSTAWRLKGAAGWTNGAAVSVSSASTATVEYFSADKAGNAEAIRTLTVPRAPVMALSGPKSPMTTSYAKGTVSGALTADGRPVRGGLVVLDRSLNGSTWTLDTQWRNTSDSGAFSFGIAPTVRAWYRVRYLPGSRSPGYQISRTVVALPKAYLGKPAAPTRVRRGAKFTISGDLKPKHTSGSSAVKLVFERRENGAWKKRKATMSAKVYTSSGYSKYRVTTTLPYKGTWRIRAYHADSGHAAGYSASRVLTVY